jgi:hypothetical protein
MEEEGGEDSGEESTIGCPGITASRTEIREYDETFIEALEMNREKVQHIPGTPKKSGDEHSSFSITYLTEGV